MKIIINGKLMDFSDPEVVKSKEKATADPNSPEQDVQKKVIDQGKEFLDNAHKFNKLGKKGDELK